MREARAISKRNIDLTASARLSSTTRAAPLHSGSPCAPEAIGNEAAHQGSLAGSKQLLQPEVLGQRRRQEQAGVGYRVVIGKGDPNRS